MLTLGHFGIFSLGMEDRHMTSKITLLYMQVGLRKSSSETPAYDKHRM